jgi:hypothetical protein
MLNRWALYLRHAFNHFAIFWIGSHVFALLAPDFNPPTYSLLHSWDHRCAPLEPVFSYL